MFRRFQKRLSRYPGTLSSELQTQIPSAVYQRLDRYRPYQRTNLPNVQKRDTSNYKEFKQKSVKHKVVNGKWELKTWKNTPKNWMNTTSSLYRQVPSVTAIATAIRSGLSDYRKVDARVIAALGVGAAIGLDYAF